MDRMRGGELAMFFGTSANVKILQDEGIDTTFLPFFGQDGQQWLMTTPYFQVALNRELEQDSARRNKAIQVLHVMLSEEAQNHIVYDGQDILSYSQNVSLRLTDYLEDVRPVVEQNHMYIRIASNDFFSISKDVVSRMIAGEYTAEQAYQAFNAQLLADEPASNAAVLTSDKGYSNVFHADSGNAAFSVMANTLRGVYDTDVLIAAANSFTGSVLAADYTKKMAASMIMPNSLLAYRRTMNGAELTETVRAFVEGCEGGFTPFNRGSLPVVSGIAIEVKEENGGFTLTGIKRDGKPLREDDSVTVTCLATAGGMAPLLADESRAFEGGDTMRSGHLERVCFRRERRTGGAGKLYYIEVNRKWQIKHAEEKQNTASCNTGAAPAAALLALVGAARRHLLSVFLVYVADGLSGEHLASVRAPASIRQYAEPAGQPQPDDPASVGRFAGKRLERGADPLRSWTRCRRRSTAPLSTSSPRTAAA